MSDKVILYYNPMSRGRIVHWLLEEIGADYELKVLDWQKSDHKSPDYLKLNPMGKIPTLVHNNTVVTETAAICAYLADAFPEAGLAPALNDPARGTYYRWLFFTTNCVEAALLDKQNPRTTPIESSHLSYGSFETMLSALEGVISKGYILGDKFSAADVYLASNLGWALMNKNLEPKPVILNYLKKCTERPAYLRMMEQAGPVG